MLGSDISVHPDEARDQAIVLACGLLTMNMISTGAHRKIVAAPTFGHGGTYHSVVIARPGHYGEGIFAVNEFDSWSGWHGYLRYLADTDRVGKAQTLARDHSRLQHITVTGSHSASVDAVTSGRADYAAIDSTVWQWLCKIDPTLQVSLQIVERTNDWPAPPISVSLSSPGSLEMADALANCDSVVPVTAYDYGFMLS